MVAKSKQVPKLTYSLGVFALALRLLFLVVAFPGIGNTEVSVPIRIGVLTELTGQSATAVQECRFGLELGTLAFRGETGVALAELIIADTQENPQTAISEFQKLVDHDGVYAVVSTRSKIALPVGAVARQKRVPLIATSAHPALTTDNPFAVRVYPSAAVEGPFLAGLARKSGARKIAVVTIEDEWNVALSKSFVESMSAAGLPVVFNESIDGTTRDFGTLVSKLKTSGADTLFLNLLLSQAGGFAKRMLEQRVHPKVVSNFWIQMPETVAAAGAEAVEGIVFSEIDFRKPQVTAAYAKQFPGKELSAAAYYCYVVLAAAVQPLRHATVTPTRESYAQQLLELTSIDLLDGAIEVRNREVQFTLTGRKLLNGKSVPLDGSPRK